LSGDKDDAMRVGISLTTNYPDVKDPRQGARWVVDLRLVIGQMAYQHFGVSDFLESPELLRDFVDRARDQGFRRHAAVAAATRRVEQICDALDRSRGRVFPEKLYDHVRMADARQSPGAR
jgi:hypothetical protein